MDQHVDGPPGSTQAPEPGKGEMTRRIVRSPGWDRLVTGAGILLLAVFGLFLARGWTAGRAAATHPGAGVRSLVVLPPVPLSERGDEAVWADRLAQALRAELAHRVKLVEPPAGAAGAPAASYLPSLAADAGADALLGGTLYLTRDEARLQLRLVPATSGGPRWSRRYAVSASLGEDGAGGAPEKLARQVGAELFARD